MMMDDDDDKDDDEEGRREGKMQGSKPPSGGQGRRWRGVRAWPVESAPQKPSSSPIVFIIIDQSYH